jgi:hypothetical protein
VRRFAGRLGEGQRDDLVDHAGGKPGFLVLDPAFAAKLRDVVGLHLDPPAHSLALSVDKKSQIQALDRTQLGLPIKKVRVRPLGRHKGCVEHSRFSFVFSSSIALNRFASLTSRPQYLLFHL